MPGSTTDTHFTVLCFTFATDDPVMCCNIYRSEKNLKDIPLSWKVGFNIRKEKIAGKNVAETFLMNTASDGAMGGSLKCFFNNKIVPCFVGTSPKASISSVLFAAMLKGMDSLKLFDCKNGKKAFFLLNGQRARMVSKCLCPLWDTYLAGSQCQRS